MHTSEKGQRRQLAILSASFFFSGFASLMCQVTWQRLLGVYYGVGPVSTALVVSAFMFGLGLGVLALGFVLGMITGAIAESGDYVAAELLSNLVGLVIAIVFGASGNEWLTREGLSRLAPALDCPGPPVFSIMTLLA